MATKIKEIKPLLPFVSKEQLMAFDPKRQETYTESRVVNEVLEAIEHLRTIESREVARYLAVDEERLRHTMQLVTGLTVNEIIRMKQIARAKAIKAVRPYYSGDDVAQAIGYGDHTTLFRLFGREEYDKLFAKYKKNDY